MSSKVAFITGASKGVGRGIAYGLADDGWDLVINYHSDRSGAEETLSRVESKGRKCLILGGNIGVKSEVATMFDSIKSEFGRLDCMVNNAGRQTWAPLLELKEEDWDKTINTNLKGSFLCTQYAAKIMKQQDSGGSIINIGSGANKQPFMNLIDYCASKGGLDQLTRVSACELGQYGIRVNCVGPGAIEIERTKEESPNYAETWSAITPLERVGTVEDVAQAVVFLAGDSSEFITGQSLYVDGGLWTKAQWPYEAE